MIVLLERSMQSQRGRRLQHADEWNIHLMLLKEIMLQLMFILWFSSMTFFFVCNLFIVRFAVT